MSWADNSVKNWPNLPSSYPKPELHNIKAHTKFGENPLKFTQVIVQKGKYGGTTMGQTYGRSKWYHNTLPLSVAGYKK